MILHGKNIIVSIDDTAIAAAKSCTINIAASTIPTASPISGSWESHIPARKSWSVKTSHLLFTPIVPDGKITAVSYGFNGASQRTPSYIVDGTGRSIQTITRGISAIRISNTPPYTFIDNAFTTWDTYSDPDAAPIVNYMDSNRDCIIALVCTDAFALTQDMVAAFTNTGKNVTPPILTSGRHALSIICGNVISKGVYTLTDNDGKTDSVAGVAISEVFLRAGNVISQTPMRDAALLAGKNLSLRIEVMGFPYDYLEGRAICKQFEVASSVNSLLKGSFEFQGTGPLE